MKDMKKMLRISKHQKAGGYYLHASQGSFVLLRSISFIYLYHKCIIFHRIPSITRD